MIQRFFLNRVYNETAAPPPGGEDNLVIGTDYGHADTASELLALRTFQEESGVSPEATSKILDDNARALYGL